MHSLRLISARCLLLCFVSLISTTFTLPAHAQITFAWGSPEPDIAVYTTVEECLGILHRIRAEHNPGILHWYDRFDTLAPASRLRLPLEFQPLPVTEAARRCAAKFTVDGVVSKSPLDLNETENAFHLFQFAGRTEDAIALATRWLATFPNRHDTTRNIVAFRLAMSVAAAKPARVADVWQLLSLMDTVTFWGYAMDVVGTAFNVAAFDLRDTATAEELQTWLSRAPSWLGDSITSSWTWQDPREGKGKYVVGALRWKKTPEIYQALRTSTPAYFDYLDSISAQAKLNARMERKKAVPVVADSWFPAKPPTDRPTAGQVSIVNPVVNSVNFGRGYYKDWIELLKEFPTVEVTFLFITRGYHGTVIAPPPAEEEARLIDSLFRKVHGLPVTIAVHHTKFWHLPDPDRRRVNEPGPNEAVYPILTAPLGSPTYLIDREGWLIPNVDRKAIHAVLSQKAP